jgi:hypothetical protein
VGDDLRKPKLVRLEKLGISEHPPRQKQHIEMRTTRLVIDAIPSPATQKAIAALLGNRNP